MMELTEALFQPNGAKEIDMSSEEMFQPGEKGAKGNLASRKKEK
jgi:hypothetical protein